MNFETAIEHVLSAEGGYVFDPDDSGGETHWGISKRSYPHLNIKALTRAEAIKIYYRDFWLKVRADELPVLLRLHVFDFAVNAGVPLAIKTLQHAAGAKKDGIIGPNTLKAAKRIELRDFTNARIRHYTSLAKARPKDQKYLNGWLIRNSDVTIITLTAA